MNKWLRRGALAAATLAAFGVATLALGTQLGERRMNRHIELAVHPVAWRSDAASIERGATSTPRAAAPTATARTSPGM